MASKDEKKDKKDSAHVEKSEPEKTDASKDIRMLYRPMHDKMVAGVVAGIARYVGVDVSIARIIAFVLFLVSPIKFLLIYIIAAIVIPEKDVNEESVPKRDTTPIIGWTLVIAGLYYLAGSLFKIMIPDDMLWGLALIALGAFFLRRR